MKIGSYDNNRSFVRSGDATKSISKSDSNGNLEVAKASGAKKSDTLEISNDAIRFDSIKERIESGYYDKHLVLNEVAQRIMNQLGADI